MLSPSGHCIQHPEEQMPKLIHSTEQGRCGEYHITYIDNLKQDTDLKSIQELKVVMIEKELVLLAWTGNRPNDSNNAGVSQHIQNIKIKC